MWRCTTEPSTPDNPTRELEFRPRPLSQHVSAGLIANQFVEVNDPNNTTCATGCMGIRQGRRRLADAGATSPTSMSKRPSWPSAFLHREQLRNSSKTINYSINQFGATAENFFELFGYFTGTAHCRPATTPCPLGQPLRFLGPPAYLKTGTQSNAPYWNITSTDVCPGDLVHQQLDLCAVAADHRPADGDVGLHRHPVYKPFRRAPADPSVAGDTYAQAQTALTAAGFQSTESYRTSGTVPIKWSSAQPRSGTRCPRLDHLGDRLAG